MLTAFPGIVVFMFLNVHSFQNSPQNNDHMKNTVHRHEPPVVGKPLEVLVDDGEVLVVDKPASIPVHPCGRFRHNTVIFILGKELGISELHTVHRLDRLTSGVLLFARTLETSKKLDQLVRDRQVCSWRGVETFDFVMNTVFAIKTFFLFVYSTL